jgi:nicotinamide mononucleotide transporter
MRIMHTAATGLKMEPKKAGHIIFPRPGSILFLKLDLNSDRMAISDWLSNNWIEIFGAITGIIYVFLEIRQNIWLWPVGIVTSAVYIIVFFTSKFYADMSLQVYYLVISFVGWYWWVKGSWRRAQGTGHRAAEASRLPSMESLPRFGGGLGVGNEETKRQRDEETKRQRNKETERLSVARLKLKTGRILSCFFVLLYFMMWLVLSRYTDSPVPGWDSFITSLSIIATWMLARKIYEHWFLWIVVNSVSVVLFSARGLYPTAILYMVYLVMSFAGLKEWKRSL